MDSLNDWRDVIERTLTEYASIPYARGDVRSEVVFDRVRDRYLLVDVGWDRNVRQHGTLVHMDIIDGKVWVHYDGTERGLANDLVAAGIPRDHIVLAFHAPAERRFTDFAVG